jgi:peptidoglycan/LPS O-acetylase OafA/YrhL
VSAESTASAFSVAGQAAGRTRLLAPDVLRVLGAQLIVWHHLSVYGPLPQWLQTGLPQFMDFLFNQARYAVQVFVVLGGYLAMRGLGTATDLSVWRLIVQRYMRLIQVYWPVLAFTLLVSALTRDLLAPDLVPQAPDGWRLLSHLFLLHGVLGHSALSAGVWYVAMDLQLFALLVLMVALVRRAPRAHQQWLCSVALSVAVAASLLVFNRQPALDDWAPYFFCAYGLGALAGLAPHARTARGLLALMLALSCWAAWQEPRPRVVLAVLTTLLLLVSVRGRVASPAVHRPLAWLFRLSDASYALFLLNFSVVLLANAVWTLAGWQGFDKALGLVLLAWAMNLVLADASHRWLEKPMRLAHGLRRLGGWVRPDPAQGRDRSR